LLNFSKKTIYTSLLSCFWDIFAVLKNEVSPIAKSSLFKNTFFGLLVLMCIKSAAYSQQSVDITQALIQQGFRNVKVYPDSSNLIISFENDRYRFLPDAILKSEQTIRPFLSEKQNVLIIIQKLSIPVFQFRIHNFPDSISDNNVSSRFSDFDTNISNNWKKIKKIKSLNSSLGRINIFVKPEINWQIGNYKYPFRFLINLVPTIQTSLWKGMFLNAQMIIPTVDNHYTNNYKYIRPGIISVNQIFRLPQQSFVSITAGLFSDFRYGTSVQLAKYFFKGRCMIEGTANYTGYGTYLNHGGTDIYLNKYYEPSLVIAPLSYLNFNGAVNFFIPRYQLFARASYGTWLYYQKVSEVMITRKFNEVSLGFIFQDFGGKNNFGISLTLPLYPYKYFFNKKISIRPSESINFSYFAKNNYAYDFRTGWTMKALYEDFHPLFARKSISY
jgi:hypothetical protein